MAKQKLPVNFQDDIMNSSMNGKRRYKMINNSDDTISLEDATTYDQVGSNFGAGQINQTNQAINESFDKNKVIDDLDAINVLTKSGYAAGGLAVKELSDSLGELVITKNLTHSFSVNANRYTSFQIDTTLSGYKFIGVIGYNSGNTSVITTCMFKNSNGNLDVALQNVSSAQLSGTFNCIALYVKN